MDKLCECGTGAVYAKGQCKRCYHRNWQRQKHGYSPRVSGPLTYLAAHARTVRAKGRAAEQGLCAAGCGRAAEQWAYNNTSAEEIVSTREQTKNGQKLTITCRYSGNPDDYDALCIPCHIERDRGQQ